MRDTARRPRRTTLPLRAAALLLAATVGLTACREASASRQEVLSEGDVATTDTAALYARLLAEPLEVALTEERYERWRRAQRVLDTLPWIGVPSPDGRRRSPDTPQELIAHGVRSLEQDDVARRAIEDAGLDVPEYVTTTVALHRAVAASRRNGYWGVPEESLELARDHRDAIEAHVPGDWLVGERERTRAEEREKPVKTMKSEKRRKRTDQPPAH